MARKRLEEQVRMDRRKMQNREAAERCRKKKLGIIKELEKKVKFLESLLDQCEKCKALRLQYSQISCRNECTDTEDSSPSSVYSTVSNCSSQSSLSTSNSIDDDYQPQNSTASEYSVIPIREPVLYQFDDHNFVKPMLPRARQPSMRNHLEALANPRDLVQFSQSTTMVQYSAHHMNVPIVLRSPDAGTFVPRFSPGGLMVGSHQLRDLFHNNTGLTPGVIILSPTANRDPHRPHNYVL